MSQVQICVRAVLIIYRGKKASETVMQLHKCIMQKRIQFSQCHTRQTYSWTPAKDTQNITAPCPEFCWLNPCALLPALRNFIITKFREKKQAYFELWGYGDQTLI